MVDTFTNLIFRVERSTNRTRNRGRLQKRNIMGVRATLAVLLLFIATVEAEGKGGVEFWSTNFTMICPGNGTWFKKLEHDENEENKGELELQYAGNNKGFYHCEYQEDGKTNRYYFFVKGKVCENCYELDASLVAVVIVADVVGTVCVMYIIYRCTKKKSSAGPSQASKAPARPGGRPPPAQNPDYEPLSPHTRSQDPYSVVNRMG
ncbi:LOW QUALITY PROTEIN: T-cell surface glycoprotein CD3 epsilon chain-like [Anoplopoma fimbria]|uniref:LOW QUALITY PROTEIN: T-cell surface glycoprotein CD3 epsilon chain-like n=1 Tax=Anoplopoma fimbria TaxID=229290 RepID=UPI0023EDF7A2|nr:LOW QUALITY PROTEIN: T-cell surface glycoprotein CD3 epsilon chain-like [Anoplopoma fimbria]